RPGPAEDRGRQGRADSAQSQSRARPGGGRRRSGAVLMGLAATADIFAALALELERAGQLCDQLEAVMAKLVEASGTTAPHDAMRDAQAVDALGQHLRGLARFSETLAQQPGGPAVYDVGPALQTITLAA